MVDVEANEFAPTEIGECKPKVISIDEAEKR